MSLTIEARLLDKSCSEPEIHRFQIPKEDSASYERLITKICVLFPILQPGSFSVRCKDEDGENVAFSTDEGLQDALKFVSDGVLKIFLLMKNENSGSDGRPVFTEHDMMKGSASRSRGDHRGAFAPSPQFRKWMRKFMKRWHIRHAPDGKGAAQDEKKVETVEHSSAIEDQESDEAVAEFIEAVEDAMTTCVGPSEDDNEETNDVVDEETITVNSNESPGKKRCGKRPGKKGNQKGNLASDTNNDNKDNDSEQPFAPPPQFRRWMRRFMKRWHIRHAAPGEKGAGRVVEAETVEHGSGNDDQDVDDAVAEFIKAVEDAVTTFVKQQEHEETNNNPDDEDKKANAKNESAKKEKCGNMSEKKENQEDKSALDTDNPNKGKDSNGSKAKKRFIPPPQFRRWMRKFVKRWHIRHAPNEAGIGQCEKAKAVDHDSGNDELDSGDAIEEFINDVEDAVSTFVEPSGIDNDDVDGECNKENDKKSSGIVEGSTGTGQDSVVTHGGSGMKCPVEPPLESIERKNGKNQCKNKSIKKEKRSNKLASDTDNANNGNDSEPKGVSLDEKPFVPSPHFRRWMRKFMKRWHIRHAPGEKGAGQGEKAETAEHGRNVDGQELDDAVAEFIKAVEEAVTSFTGSVTGTSGDPCDST